MAYRIPVMLTPSQVRAVMAVFTRANGNQSEQDIATAAKRALENHNNKVRDAENLLSRIRDSEE